MPTIAMHTATHTPPDSMAACLLAYPMHLAALALVRAAVIEHQGMGLMWGRAPRVRV